MRQIYDLLPGRPQGRAKDGVNPTVNSDPTVYRNGEGDSGSNTLILDSAAFANGDLIFIQQVKGDADFSQLNCEPNLIISGGGTTTLTLAEPLQRDYRTRSQSNVQFGSSTHNGLVTQAKTCMVQSIPEYRNAAFSFTISAWNGKVGGLFVWCDTGESTGTIIGNGAVGSVGFDGQGVNLGGGFRGGWNSVDGSASGVGEGSVRFYPQEVDGTASPDQGATGHGSLGPGAGGGNYEAGEAGPTGRAGNSIASDDLVKFWWGGGGSGARYGNQQPAGSNAGANCICWAESINFTAVQLEGGQSSPIGTEGNSPGGGGAGGNFLGNVNRAKNLANISCGGGARRNAFATAGGKGKVRINYGSTIADAGTPTRANFTSSFDPKLAPSGGGIFAVL